MTQHTSYKGSIVRIVSANRQQRRLAKQLADSMQVQRTVCRTRGFSASIAECSPCGPVAALPEALTPYTLTADYPRAIHWRGNCRRGVQLLARVRPLVVMVLAAAAAAAVAAAAAAAAAVFRQGQATQLAVPCLGNAQELVPML